MCDCGNVEPIYYPDENQYEPGCWECYYQQHYAGLEPEPEEEE